jgi:hypothetical protein
MGAIAGGVFWSSRDCIALPARAAIGRNISCYRGVSDYGCRCARIRSLAGGADVHNGVIANAGQPLHAAMVVQSDRLWVLGLHVLLTYMAILTTSTVIFGLLLAGFVALTWLIHLRNWRAATSTLIGYGALLATWWPLTGMRAWP